MTQDKTVHPTYAQIALTGGAKIASFFAFMKLGVEISELCNFYKMHIEQKIITV